MIMTVSLIMITAYGAIPKTCHWTLTTMDQDDWTSFHQALVKILTTFFASMANSSFIGC